MGVLALQGAFVEHAAALLRVGVMSREVRLPEHLQGLDGLIIPGGESTAIRKLASSADMVEALRDYGQTHPVRGTCAGAILLAREVQQDQPLLNLMDIVVHRNAFGRQVDSFEMDLSISALEQPEIPYRAIFIRAPRIIRVGRRVDVLARLPETVAPGEAGIAAARQGNLLATTFHPELTDDVRFHRYFVKMVQQFSALPS